MAKKGLEARLVAPGDLGLFDALAATHGCFFDRNSWASLFGPSLQRIGLYDAGGSLRGGFCLYGQQRFGLRVLRNPPFTPQVGPFFEGRATNPAAKTDEQRAVVEAMAGYLASSGAAVVSLGLSLGVTDCLPFYWRGYKVIPHYTYRIDLKQSEEDLLAAMSVDRRNDIRKAQKDGLAVEEVSDVSELGSLVIGTFARKDKRFPREMMDPILQNYPPGQDSFCIISRYQGQPVAGVYVIFDSRSAYYLMGGYCGGAHHGAGPLAMYHAIMRAKSQGLGVFDFEGSIIPPIEKYFRGFGGQLTPVFGVHKAWLPLEMGLKLLKRELF